MSEKLLKTCVSLLVLCLAAASAQDAPDEPPRPNIIVVFVDDLGYGDLSAFGATAIDTPNIDRLGEEGVIMTNWYAASNVCTPSRAGLLTGRYAPRSGTQFFTRPHSTWGLPKTDWKRTPWSYSLPTTASCSATTA